MLNQQIKTKNTKGKNKNGKYAAKKASKYAKSR